MFFVMILTMFVFWNRQQKLQISENKKKLKRLVKVLQSECRQHQRTPPNQLACWGKNIELVLRTKTIPRRGRYE